MISRKQQIKQWRTRLKDLRDMLKREKLNPLSVNDLDLIQAELLGMSNEVQSLKDVRAAGSDKDMS